MTSGHKYEAFVSYSHADRATAAWLQRALERLRIPRHLVDAKKLPRNRFRPLFRDEDELAGAADLPTMLQQALADSANLIVVCSPAAARSRWVEQEVATFVRTRDARRIFCVLVAGDPDAPETCFPPSLRTGTIPLAIDLRRGAQSRRHALLRLAAGLLDTGFDDLRRRAGQERRRRLRYQLSAALLLVTAAAAVTWQIAIEPPCTSSEQMLAGTWNPASRTRIKTAFGKIGLPYADAVLQRVMQRLESYQRDWVNMHRDSCEATLVRNEQSPRLMDLRMACLDERRDEFSSMVALLADADQQVVESAVTSVGSLRSLSRCADRSALEAAYPLPEDPQTRADIATLQQQILTASTAINAGQIETASRDIESLLSAAQAIDYPALETQALLLQAQIDISQGRSDAAREAIYAAAAKAVLASDNELIARTWLTLPGIMINNKTQLKEAMQLIELAQSYISQLPPQHPLEAQFHAVRGEILLRQGALGEGVKNLRAAVAIGRELKLADLAPLLSRLSWGLSSLHESAEAASAAREAVDVSWRDFGPDHPQHARALLEWARSEATLGYRESAVAAIESAAAIEEAAYAGPSPRLAATLEVLGRSYSQTGRYPEAISTFERVIEMEQKFDVPNSGNIAAAYNDMGDTYISMGEYDAARSALESALAIWQQQQLQTMIGIGLGNLGNVSNRAGLYVEAADYCRRALANDEQFLPLDHPDLAYPLSCLGEALLNTDNAESALEPLKRAHQLRSRIDVDEASLAWTRWLYGRALYEAGRDRQLGLRYVRFARDTFTTMGDAAGSELHDVTTWLAALRN